MALFGRRQTGSIPPSSAVPGRRLSTSLDLARCEPLFRTLAAEEGGYTDFVPAAWAGDDAPASLVVAVADGKPALYLAAWDRGPYRELKLVPASNPDALPPTLIGAWKMQDPSLSSIGTVTKFPVAR